MMKENEIVVMMKSHIYRWNANELDARDKRDYQKAQSYKDMAHGVAAMIAEIDERSFVSQLAGETHEPPEHTECPFAQDELKTLSNALLMAIQNNNEAGKLTVSHGVVEAIERSNEELSALNSKICSMMKD